MRVRELRRLVLLVIPLLLVFYTGFLCLDTELPGSCYRIKNWIGRKFYSSYRIAQHKQEHTSYQVDSSRSSSSSNNGQLGLLPSASSDTDDDVNESGGGFLPNPSKTHVELFSLSTPDKKYFQLRFGDKLAINPNIIPHPLLDNTWAMIAQLHDPLDTTHTQFVELACDATFDESKRELRCVFPPVALPIAPTGLGNCKDELEYFNLNAGPHDARVFYGPRTPFVVYGSNSHEICFGQWMQNFRVLMSWEGGAGDQEQESSLFKLGTELHRPTPYSVTEKNWFVFWDVDGQMYAHYDVAPRRAFAKLHADGSAGPDLAPLAAAAGDERCLDKYMPKPGPVDESIHQATNSLSVTMCRRYEPGCRPSDANTFVFTIFHHKTFREFHGTYEPYVMVFEQRPPFRVYGVSRKPLWIHGRERASETRSQMFYVTSVSWKASGQKYHGYLDDVLILGFGIEDQDAAGIDVLASDLLTGLDLCSGDGGS